jgi:hypothetical protein
MPKNIVIPKGIVVVGNSQDTDLVLAGLNNNNISSFKTLVNGVWKSWSLGTPDAFQGFTALKKGYGYVVNATALTDITFDGDALDVNTLNVNPGLNVLALPYQDKLISGGYLPRLKINTLKTIDGTWKSWTAGTPDSFQGFTALDDSKGYVCNVQEIYDTYLNNTYRNVNDGVMLGEVTNLTNSNIIDLIEGFNHSLQIKSIEADAVIPVNEALPKKSMFLEVEGIVREIKFPEEVLGVNFVVRKLAYDVIDYGLITDPTVEPTIDYGLITDTVTDTFAHDLISHVEVLVAKEYEFTFVENTNPDAPVQVETLIIDDVLEIMYDKVAFDPIPAKKLMNLNLGGVLTRLSFAVEYTGRPFVIIKDNINYQGTFAESEPYIVL